MPVTPEATPIAPHVDLSSTPRPRSERHGFAAPVLEVHALVRRGQIRAALGALTAIELDRADPATTLDAEDRALLGALSIECHLARGELTEAEEVAARLAGVATGDGLTAALARYSRADVASARGAAEEAAAGFLAAGAADDSGLAPWRSGAALALLRLGRRAEALELAREHRERMAGADDYHVAWALRTLATTDPDGRGVARLREAQLLVETLDAARLRAQIDTDLAGLLVLLGRTDEALGLLRPAESYAAREDLWPLGSRIRRLLERLGEEPRRIESEVLAGVTAAERRVTVLVLDGHTNREIAERLGVSVKAVEGHLSKVYRKLGVASRRGLRAMLRAAP